MEISMKNRVVLITGGSRGIGAELVRSFCSLGAKVYFTFKSNQQAAQEIMNSTGAIGKKVDGANEKEVEEFCDYAKSIGLDNVYCISIEDIIYINEFDAIWACASLLHIELNKLEYVFNKCYKALKNNGVMYVSFKYGTFEGFIDDRFFTYLTEERFTNIINQTNYEIDKLWITEDKLNRDVKWLSLIIGKQ